LLRSFAPMAGALPPNPEAPTHGSRRRMWPRIGTGRDAAWARYDRDRERQGHMRSRSRLRSRSGFTDVWSRP